MRFVLSLGLFCLLSTSSWAAPWETVSLSEANKKAPQTVRLQKGGTGQSLRTIDSLDITRAATSLGRISAIARDEAGTLYTVDAQTGRIWALSDRGLDGTIDARRPLTTRFSNPTGLAAYGKTLYVADDRAVWAIAPQSTPRQLASLANINSAGGPHLLSIDKASGTLYLALETQGGTVKLLSLDRETGQASLVAERANSAPLHSLAVRGETVWLSAAGRIGPITAQGAPILPRTPLIALALPGQYETPRNWPPALSNMIIAAQNGPAAMQLLAIPTEFGGITGDPHILIDGFMSGSGRSAWGQPGPMVMDGRGLFFADSFNGTLYKLAAKAAPQPKITIVDTDSLPPAPQAPAELAAKRFGIESTIQGTQIDAKSTITAPSSIIHGSQLIKDYDAKKAAEEAEKTENAPKSEKRRMSRSRAQPNE